MTTHAMSRTTHIVRRVNGRFRREPITNRRAHLELARSVDGTCRICGDTGVYQPPWTPAIFDEHRGHRGQVSDEQIAEYVAFNETYCVPIPCFNPDCQVERPMPVCSVCGGFGQMRIGNRLMDTVCGECDGFGVPRAVEQREAA